MYSDCIRQGTATKLIDSSNIIVTDLCSRNAITYLTGIPVVNNWSSKR